MIKKNNLKKYFFILVALGTFFSFNIASAVGIKDSFSESNSNLKSFSSQSGYGEAKDPEFYIGLVLTSFFSVLGIIAVALLIYSGFVWMTARGNEAKVTKAKENITSVIIGLIFIIGSYALTAFLLKIFS